MQPPTFFILGAPKCGTTSLSHWLAQHERVFFSPVKEPNYFNTDSAHGDIFSLEQYEACFADATAHHQAVGEGSVWYLSSTVAVTNILQYAPDAVFIVCIRNPVAAAVSLHRQAVYNAEESLHDFLQAWEAQPLRQTKQLTVPANCLDLTHLLYGPAYLFGQQLQRLYSIVDSERVLVVTLDDISTNPAAVYSQALRHIGVSQNQPVDFAPKNQAKVRRWPLLSVLLQRLAVQKTRLKIRSGTGLGATLSRWNTRVAELQPVSPAVVSMLKSYFNDDMLLCSELLNRDLSEWTRQP